MKKDDWQYLDESIRKLSRAPLYIDETGAIGITEFTSKAKRMVIEKGVKIIFLDYLQLMTAPNVNAAYREQVVSEASRQLKATAKELKIPIIAMAQLNRNVIGRQGSSMGRPQLSDLRDSGSIEQDADIVLFIHRPGLLGLTEDPDTAELIVAKHRAGQLANINMHFLGDQVLFVEDGRSLADVAKGMSDSAKADIAPVLNRSEPAPDVSSSPFDDFLNIKPSEFI